MKQPHFAMFIDTSAQTAPQPPASLTANASTGRVQLAWDPPSSDGGQPLKKYRVYRATTPGGQALNKTPLATLSKTVTSFNDTTVQDGTTYHYVVVATNALGSSGPSDERSATPQGTTTVTPPGAPTGLSASTPPGVVHLTWSAPTDTGGAPVTTYRVYRGTAPGEEDLTTPIGSPTAATFDDTDVVAGVEYSYVVAAVNSAGQGAPSGEVTVTATPGSAGVPGEPVLSGSLVTGTFGRPGGRPAVDHPHRWWLADHQVRGPAGLRAPGHLATDDGRADVVPRHDRDIRQPRLPGEGGQRHRQRTPVEQGHHHGPLTRVAPAAAKACDG